MNEQRLFRITVWVRTENHLFKILNKSRGTGVASTTLPLVRQLAIYPRWEVRLK